MLSVEHLIIVRWMMYTPTRAVQNIQKQLITSMQLSPEQLRLVGLRCAPSSLAAIVSGQMKLHGLVLRRR